MGKSFHWESKIYERYKFNNRLHEQSVDAYVMALKALAETFDFGTLKDDIILDRIICGVRDNCVQKKLLQESGLTLSKCVDVF